MVGLLSVALVLSLAYVFVLRMDARLYADGCERAGRSVSVLRLALEEIRDSGPTGPDPLPACRWCGQGVGHWLAPKHQECPAVRARDVLMTWWRSR